MPRAEGFSRRTGSEADTLNVGRIGAGLLQVNAAGSALLQSGEMLVTRHASLPSTIR
jgi:hypothetical protein